MGNIHSDGFLQILNNEKNLQFRRKLKKQSNDTCTRCVCSLNLPLFVNPVNSQS